ncbi:MAG: hypothetical protein KBC96_13820 [Armatimonadetes bacterium]|nr:hypothetical protein [Armatimonadota bacterium]
MPIDQDRIKKLISLVEANDLTELVVEEEGLSITIRAESPVAPQVVSVPVTEVSVGVECPSAELKDDEPPATIPAADESHLFSIESPMTGVFYRTPAPDQPHYIEIGDEIEAGQTIGLIEAMKVFSEVPSEVSGIVVDIPAASGKLVQSGDVLVVVDTSAAV